MSEPVLRRTRTGSTWHIPSPSDPTLSRCGERLVRSKPVRRVGPNRRREPWCKVCDKTLAPRDI